MKVAIPAEIDAGEPRVEATPEPVMKLKAAGADVTVQGGAGLKSGVPDADYQAMGAVIAGGAVETVADADVILKVRRPTSAELASYRRGAAVIAIMDPFGNDDALRAIANAGVTGFAMELMPRI